MPSTLTITRGMVRRISIPLFAEKPSHPFVPLDDPSAVARSVGQGRPQAGASREPLTGASTMARSCQGGDRAHGRCALLLLLVLIPIGVPSVAVSAEAVPIARPATSDPYAADVAEAARRFSIPAAWIRAIMCVESRGDQRAVSPKGAMGLMQIIPETWAGLRARYGLGHDPFDPRDNILAGAAYLRELYDRYGAPGFLAAYNAGPERYEAHLVSGRPLPEETRLYLIRVAPLIGNPARPWTEAPLFTSHAESGSPRSPAPTDQLSAAGMAKDWTALSPQCDGMFVQFGVLPERAR